MRRLLTLFWGYSASLFLFNHLISVESFAQFEKQGYEPVEIVISASRAEQPEKHVASSLSVYDAAAIEDRQDTSLVELLKSDPTVDIVSTGAKGSSTTVSIRGANPEHTLVVLDGIELNNPILPSRSFNFADLMLNEVKRVEILRGPQSTLYGSDAMGGVINIISERGEGPLAVNSFVEAGSTPSFKEHISASAGEDVYNYAFSILREDDNGVSAADSRLGNSEKDSYGNTSYFARIGLSPNPQNDLSTIFRAVDSSSELDMSGGAFADDPNRQQDNIQYFWGNSFASKFLNERLKTNLAYTLSDQTFSDDNDLNDRSLEYLRSEYKGRMDTLNGQLDYKLNNQLTVVSGAETQRESGESRYFSDGSFGPFESNFSDISATTNAIYLQANTSLWEQLFTSSGIRIDDHSKFGDEVTWKIAPSWLLEDYGTRLFSTVGTAFKAPSIFQLYSVYGSSDLKSEKSLGVDAGVEQEIIKDLLSTSITYFNQDFDNLIDFDPDTFLFSNIKSANTNGLETSVTMKLCEWTELNAGYTYLDATNDDSGAALLRRARNKFSAYLKFKPVESWDISVMTNYRSSRFDNDFSSFPAETVTLDGYTTVDILGSYLVKKNVEIFARVENVLDRNYTQVAGYGTMGVAGYGGLRLKF